MRIVAGTSAPLTAGSSDTVVARAGRARWAAIGAAIAVSLGAGSVMTTSASVSSGERAVYVPITPCRIMDTRVAPDNVGPRSAPLGVGDTHTISVVGTNGNCTIPADAVGLALNVAVVNGTAASYLTVFPAGAVRPLAANLNWVAGAPPTPNAVQADLSADGKISFFNFAGFVDVVVDVNGYYVDHTHDDRYYTKAEVDSKLSTGLAGKVDKTTGQAHSLILNPGSFAPISPIPEYSRTTNPFRLIGVDPACFVAPVELPDGATMTALTVHGLDSNPSVNSTISLRRDAVGSTSGSLVLATRTTSGSGGAYTITDSVVSPSLVDNDALLYSVELCLDTTMWLDDVVIAYTNP